MTAAHHRQPPTERRPLVVTPAQMLSIVKINTLDAAYRFGFHTLRFVFGVYIVRALLTFPRGLIVSVVGYIRWVADREGRKMARMTATVVEASGKGAGTIASAQRTHDRRVHYRLAGSAVGAAAIGLAGLNVWLHYSWPPLAAAGLFAAAVIGYVGRDRDEPFLDNAAAARRHPTITLELLADVLSNIGVADLTKALWNKDEKRVDPSRLRVRSGRTPDNTGQLIEIELPTGITADMIMTRASRVAGGLRRADDQVYLERAHGRHAGVLMMTVLDAPASTSPAPTFVVPRTVDVFKPIPVGFRPGGEPISMRLIFQSMLIGGAPDSGKTGALRTIASVLSWDPAVQLLVSEMKGTGDLAALRPRCMFYRSGNDDDDLRATATMLQWLYREMRRRQTVIKRIHENDIARCPENKITRDLALDSELNMPVLLVVLDEFTELSESHEFGAAFDEMLDIARQARAVGIIIVLGTQRPDGAAITPRMRDLITYRAALRCLSTDANNMILGSGMSADGFDATQFAPFEQGMCWLRADDGQPQLMRWGYVAPVELADMIAEQKLSVGPVVVGHAAGQPATGGAAVDDDHRSVVEHVVDVWPADTDVMATADIAAALVDRWPDKYDSWKAGHVTRSLRRSHGLSTADRRVNGRLLKTLTRAEVFAAAGRHDTDNDTEPEPRLLESSR